MIPQTTSTQSHDYLQEALENRKTVLFNQLNLYAQHSEYQLRDISIVLLEFDSSKDEYAFHLTTKMVERNDYREIEFSHIETEISAKTIQEWAKGRFPDFNRSTLGLPQLPKKTTIIAPKPISSNPILSSLKDIAITLQMVLQEQEWFIVQYAGKSLPQSIIVTHSFLSEKKGYEFKIHRIFAHHHSDEIIKFYDLKNIDRLKEGEKPIFGSPSAPTVLTIDSAVLDHLAQKDVCKACKSIEENEKQILESVSNTRKIFPPRRIQVERVSVKDLSASVFIFKIKRRFESGEEDFLIKSLSLEALTELISLKNETS